MSANQFIGKLRDQLYWWLSSSRPFYINNEYRLDLIHIDRNHNSAKILVTNLKTNEKMELSNDQEVPS